MITPHSHAHQLRTTVAYYAQGEYTRTLKDKNRHGPPHGNADGQYSTDRHSGYTPYVSTRLS